MTTAVSDLVAFGWTDDISTAFAAHAAAGLESVAAGDAGTALAAARLDDVRAPVLGHDATRFETGLGMRCKSGRDVA